MKTQAGHFRESKKNWGEGGGQLQLVTLNSHVTHTPVCCHHVAYLVLLRIPQVLRTHVASRLAVFRFSFGDPAPTLTVTLPDLKRVIHPPSADLSKLNASTPAFVGESRVRR